MRKVCIVHFHELENFPPAINLIRFLGFSHQDDHSTLVLTTSADHHSVKEIGDTKIHSLLKWKKRTNRIRRMWKYLQFNIVALMRIIRFRPDAILYYETLSAGAPLLYKKFFRRSTEIFAHYHEYISTPEYQSGMVLNRWLHNLELGWYSRMKWISHTNRDRMNLFLKDVGSRAAALTHILPNYPPLSWKRESFRSKKGLTRFVYVGALSLETMYVKEMAEYIVTHSNECCWDIYSSNFSDGVIKYLESKSTDAIRFKGAIPYEKLPDVLSNYDVGLVLYKGHIPNYVYNVPNKLFEYHVCGIDVWFPSSMKSSMQHETHGTYPKILSLDFSQLSAVDLARATDRSGLIEYQNAFYCEEAFKPLAEKLIYGNG
jgi:hypothetical protein